MTGIDDPDLPGLADLGADGLGRITGDPATELLRLRYRPGERAVLHVASGTGDARREGALWFFRGDKARRIAGRQAAARYDAPSGGLYEAFPDDHRMPQIRDFLDRYARLAPALLGGTPTADPVLLRYRPGLSCTFRCAVAGKRTVYVKLLGDESPRRVAVQNRRMADLLSGRSLSVAPVLAIDESVRAVSYAAARGAPLADLLCHGDPGGAVTRTVEALRQFRGLRFTPTRFLSRSGLLAEAAEAARLVTATVPGCRDRVAGVLAALGSARPRLGCRPIHGDMKPEHVFLGRRHATLIDTESVALGPPDYDLAELFARLWQAGAGGVLPEAVSRAAMAEVRRGAGPGFGWCLGVAALRLARHYASRPDPDPEARIDALLDRLCPDL